MASEGPIDKLNIEVGVTPDLSGLDRAKAEAAQKGQEIGQAVAQGVSEGTKIDPLDDLKAKFAQAKQDIGALKDSSGGTGSSAAGGGMSAGALQAVLLGLMPVIEAVATSLTASTKQQLELQQAVAQMSAVMAESNAIQRQSYEARTGGNRVVGDFPLKRLQELDAENVSLQQQLDNPPLPELMTDVIQDAVYGAADAAGPLGSPIGFLGRRMGAQTRKEQVQAQIDENKARMANLGKAVRGIPGRERESGTIEGVAEQEAGLPVGSLRALGPIDTVGADMLREAFRGSPDYLETIVQLNRGSYEQQKRQMTEIIRNGVPKVQR